MAKEQFKGRTMPTRYLPITKLDMDLQNPRLLDDGIDQNDAMTKMLSTTGEKCMELLRDLTELGEVSSSELPIVVAEGNRFVVLEGNRRLLCFRIWRSPQWLNRLGSIGEKYSKRVKTYAEKSRWTAPDKIDVVVASSRDEAAEWIDKRHGLGGSGASMVPWDSFQRDRRSSQRSPAKTSRSYAFVSFILGLPEDLKLREQLWKLIDAQYTILERLLGDRSLRNALGITFSEGVVTLQYGLEETLPAIRRLIDDLADSKHNSQSLHNSQQRSQYAQELTALISKKGGTPFRGDPPKEVDQPKENVPHSRPNSGENSAENSAGRTRRRRRTTKNRIFKDVVHDQFPDRLRDLVEETARLDISKNPEIGAAVIRVILDLSIEYYEEIYDLKADRNPPIWERVKAIIAHLSPADATAKGQVQTWSPMQELHNRCTAEGMKSIQLGVHSSQMTNLATEVQAWGDRIEPLLVAMNDYLGNNPRP